MTQNRLTTHPILPIADRDVFDFKWSGLVFQACAGETIASALFANGVRIFGVHPKDGSPQGIFCANGQCAQCTVVANDIPVKACMTTIRPGMVIEPLKTLPKLPHVQIQPQYTPVQNIDIDCMIIGGGPAGLSAAIELGTRNISAILVDDKDQLGGKLVLQTHRFFGSINACYAGTRGIDIATRLAKLVSEQASIDIWTNSTVVAVFSDQKVGVVRNNNEYVLVKPKVLLVAAGAREKSLTFKGNTLPGVYGAGAFQTLLNRDLIHCSKRLFIVGGGNVGLIAGYHALQAGIIVEGLVEALPECGGYKVHKDKLARMGVPIFTSHTVLSANGHDSVESVTIAAIDEKWKPIPGTEKTYPCDTLLIAVGLDPVDEFSRKAKEYGIPTFAAGDSDEVAEASSAMFSGKIKGLEIARSLGYDVPKVPEEWIKTSEILRSKPGAENKEPIIVEEEDVYPVIHCSQEIPCNPCTSVCPQSAIYIDDLDIRHIPEYIGKQLGVHCIACEKCVAICPGLAITLVDRRKQVDETALVTIPYEFGKETIKIGDQVLVVDTGGSVLGRVEVVRTRLAINTDRTIMVKVLAPLVIANKIAGIEIQNPEICASFEQFVERLTDDMVVCRCERVSLAEIKAIISSGVRDMNQIKAITRAGMGACGGKTCGNIIKRAFRDLGIPMSQITEPVARPLFVEVSMGVLAGITTESGEE